MSVSCGASGHAGEQWRRRRVVPPSWRDTSHLQPWCVRTNKIRSCKTIPRKSNSGEHFEYFEWVLPQLECFGNPNTSLCLQRENPICNPNVQVGFLLAYKYGNAKGVSSYAMKDLLFLDWSIRKAADCKPCHAHVLTWDVDSSQMWLSEARYVSASGYWSLPYYWWHFYHVLYYQMLRVQPREELSHY